MKKLLIMTVLISSILILLSCKEKTKDDNPFLTEFDTPFGVPPFDLIEEHHFIPAFEKGMEEQKAQIQKIIDNPEESTFENTIVALDNTGDILIRVREVFYPVLSANTSEELQQIALEVAPKMSAHSDDIMLNKKLFEKVKAVYNKKENLNLNQEQRMLTELTYKNFIRSGANLDDEKQKRLREINQKLSVLTLKFGDNLLAETNSFELVIDNEKDLAGLSNALIEAASEVAKERSCEGKWVFTLHNPSVLPFLQYADNRELRKKIQQAYINRGNNNNEYDNKEIINEIVALRIERAQLLGYKNHASYILEENMAKNPENVFELLNKLWEPALKRAKNEAKEYQKMMKAEGHDFKLEAWDWRYYAEKFRKEKYDLQDKELRSYFELNNVKNGIFYVAKKLFGLTFKELKDIPTIHKDVIVYEVKDENNNHVGIFNLDFHPRDSKKGGAWMNSYRKQHIKDGEFITPVINNTCNFTSPTATLPSLLTLDEVTTFFHEFGHALHGLLSKGTYYSITGTSVPRDFVELPSQIMEHWALEREVLKKYAFHYETGEVIPDELLDKIEKSVYFDQGFATTEFLAAAFLDMYWHTLTEMNIEDVNEFEKEVLKTIKLMPEIVSRYRSTYFAHIFSGKYSAGYYSYIWSAVLDNDAFEAFKENGIFDQTTAKAFREHILEKGHSDTPANLYRNFRGRDPKIEPLLKKRGLLLITFGK